MSFDAETWLKHAVRTSLYCLPEDSPVFGALNDSAENVARALAAVTSLPIDQQTVGALLPARIPVDIPNPSALSLHFEEVVSRLVPSSAQLHPAVRHALLAAALQGEDDAVRQKKIDQLWPLFDSTSEGSVYQPTITWMALLRPEWFTSETPVVPAVRGGQMGMSKQHGVLTSVILTQGKIRINPAEMFTRTKPVSLSEAKIPSPPAVWEKVAAETWALPYPPVTALWLMGMGNKNDFWSLVPAGAALYSPFWMAGEVDALVHNQAHQPGVGHFFRPGSGISDIYPLSDDAVLAGQVNVAPLFDVPLSLSAVTAIGNLIAHAGCPVGLPDGWARNADSQCSMAEALDVIPSYSVFSSVNEDGQPRRSSARSALAQVASTNDVGAFNQLLSAMVVHQSKLARSFAAHPVDTGIIGLPATTVLWPSGSAIRSIVPPAVVPPHSAMESM